MLYGRMLAKAKAPPAASTTTQARDSTHLSHPGVSDGTGGQHALRSHECSWAQLRQSG